RSGRFRNFARRHDRPRQHANGPRQDENVSVGCSRENKEGIMDRREFNAALGAAALAGLLGSQAQAQQPAARRPLVGMLVHPDMILLDLAGPLTVFNILQAEVRLVGKNKAPVATDVGLPVTPTDSFESAPEVLDVLFVPGGLKGTVDAMKDQQTIDFL